MHCQEARRFESTTDDLAEILFIDWWFIFIGTADAQKFSSGNTNHNSSIWHISREFANKGYPKTWKEGHELKWSHTVFSIFSELSAKSNSSILGLPFDKVDQIR